MRAIVSTLGLVVSLLFAAALPVRADAPRGADDPGIVAVAASLYPCASDLAERYAATGGHPPQLVVGSSGKLARQIEAGAPFGLFLSADTAWLEYLRARGLVGAPVPLASSPLVLWWPRSVPPEPGLLAGEVRVAIADPDAAPFGAAAREYLREQGWHDRIRREKRLIVTATVLQAALAAQSGGADLALTALSVARKLGGGYTLLPVPALQHAGAPVVGRMTPPLAKFWDYLRSSEARGLWGEWGFSPPRDEPAGASGSQGGLP